MRSNAAQILIDSGYAAEKVLNFVDFPKIESVSANGNFEVVRFLEKDYPNAGSGVVVHNVKKRLVKSILLQRKKETTCEFSFDGYYPNQIVDLKENDQSVIVSERSIIMNYLTRGDVLRLWLDDVLYYSVFPDDEDGTRYIAPGETGFNLYQIRYPMLKSFPQKLKIEYGSSKALNDTGTGYHPPYYISGEMSFVSLEWEQVLNLSFYLYFETYSYAGTLTNIMEIDIANWIGAIERSYSNVGEGATAVADSYMNKTIFDVEFFTRPDVEKKKSTVEFKAVDIKFPNGWKLPNIDDKSH